MTDQSTEIESKSKMLPYGLGGKLNEWAEDNWREHRVLLSRVKNAVFKVNPAFRDTMPFRLEEGKASPLGLFAESSLVVKSGASEGKLTGEAWVQHSRSIVLGRVLFEDKDGQVYRDLDIKGVGWIGVSTDGGRGVQIRIPGADFDDGTKMGLLDKESSVYDMEMNEKLRSVGVRTPRTLAIISLEELVYNNRVVSISELKKEKVFNDGFEPVLQIRGFVDKARIGDLLDPTYKKDTQNERRKMLLDDAIKLVSQELGKKNIISANYYVEWFAKTLGENIGLMHKSGYIHGYLSEHNITLDCRIVDFDSVDALRDADEMDKDINDANETLWSFARGVFKDYPTIVQVFPNLENIFLKAYEHTFSPRKQKAYFERGKEET